MPLLLATAAGLLEQPSHDGFLLATLAQTAHSQRLAASRNEPLASIEQHKAFVRFSPDNNKRATRVRPAIAIRNRVRTKRLQCRVRLKRDIKNKTRYQGLKALHTNALFDAHQLFFLGDALVRLPTAVERLSLCGSNKLRYSGWKRGLARVELSHRLGWCASSLSST